MPSFPKLPPAVSGELRETVGRAGRLSYYVAGEGSPLLLIHSINAAGSVYEVKPIFEDQCRRRKVYAVDLPGFGMSDRSDRSYEVRLYVDAVHDLLDLIEAENGQVPIDALAVSLASEFLALAATERPRPPRTLALVTPTGFGRAVGMFAKEPGQSREIPGFYAFFTFPLWSQGIFDLLTSRVSIRYFLERTFGSKQIDEGMFEYDYLTTHQPGAKNAPWLSSPGSCSPRASAPSTRSSRCLSGCRMGPGGTSRISAVLTGPRPRRTGISSLTTQAPCRISSGRSNSCRATKPS